MDDSAKRDRILQLVSREKGGKLTHDRRKSIAEIYDHVLKMEDSTLAEWRQLSSAKGFRPQKKDRKRMRVRSGFPGRHAQNSNVIDESAELDNAVLSMNQSGLSKYTLQEEGTKRISMLQEMKETFQES